MKIKLIASCLTVIPLLFAVGAVVAANQYGPGVSDNEIKIGQTSAYSGPGFGVRDH
jgi:hypothetical protein